jgi:hypothetical protein
MIQSRIESRRDRDDKQSAGNGGDMDTGSTDPWADKSITEKTKDWEAGTS